MEPKIGIYVDGWRPVPGIEQEPEIVMQDWEILTSKDKEISIIYGWYGDSLRKSSRIVETLEDTSDNLKVKTKSGRIYTLLKEEKKDGV